MTFTLTVELNPHDPSFEFWRAEWASLARKMSASAAHHHSHSVATVRGPGITPTPVSVSLDWDECMSVARIVAIPKP